MVAYLPERVSFTSPDEALRFVEMLGDGASSSSVHAARCGRRCAATATARRSRSAAPACRGRRSRPRTERRARFGFGAEPALSGLDAVASGAIFTPGPIVDDVATPLM